MAAARRADAQDCLGDFAMTRLAWVMKLKPGNEAVYKQKHDEIWPQMLELMERTGVRTFSIYRHGLLLFAYQEKNDEVPSAPPDPIVWKWWEMMAPYMETNADFSPVQEPVEEMFHFSRSVGS
jgi:L-rhamnose mutarotase